jgi:uncharacterized phage-associated protein
MQVLPPYRSIAVANWFIQNDPGLTPLKLQKLIYYAHGWHLAINNSPLIDEVIQAWEYGPVVPQVYHEFKQFGSRPIPAGALGTLFELSPARKVRIVTPIIPPEDQKTHEFLKEILKVFGPYSAIQLSRSTHQDGTPWAKVHAANPLRKGMEIPDREIKAYFDVLAARSDAQSS